MSSGYYDDEELSGTLERKGDTSEIAAIAMLDAGIMPVIVNCKLRGSLPRPGIYLRPCYGSSTGSG